MGAISEAPEVARAVAEEMIAAYPDLEDCGGIVGADESGHGGKVVVITDPLGDTKKACLQALKSPKRDLNRDIEDVWAHAKLFKKDWTTHLESGFNDGKDERII